MREKSFIANSFPYYEEEDRVKAPWITKEILLESPYEAHKTYESGLDDPWKLYIRTWLFVPWKNLFYPFLILTKSTLKADSRFKVQGICEFPIYFNKNISSSKQFRGQWRTIWVGGGSEWDLTDLTSFEKERSQDRASQSLWPPRSSPPETYLVTLIFEYWGPSGFPVQRTTCQGAPMS